MYYEVIPTEVFRSGGGVLTYSSEQPLQAGQIVLVPLGRKTTLGIVYRKVTSVNFPTKPITRLVCPFPLPKHLIKAIFWLSQYYLTSIPLVANLLIPAGLLSKNALRGYLEAPERILDPKCGNTALTLETTLKTPLNASKISPEELNHPKITPQEPQKHSKPPKNTPKTPEISPSATAKIPLNSAQIQALAALKRITSSTKLLRGITGSGKTNIYMQLAAETLASHQSVVLLVPEIALTSQLVKAFRQTFGDQILRLIHSQQTMTERRKTWLDIITTPDPQIIIGPRSALLTPVQNLGLIIIDEAHESAYYQENPPRYSALRLASFIAAHLKIPCILGTATPNLVDYHLATSKHSLVNLTQKAKTSETISPKLTPKAKTTNYELVQKAKTAETNTASEVAEAQTTNQQPSSQPTTFTPQVTIVDLKQRDLFLKNRYFSTPLLTAIEKNIQDNHQTLIFHNRRGSAPLTICEKCGWQALCPECFLPMILHADSYTLECHICGHSQKVPTSCPDCHHPEIIHKGFGTKLLESELTKLFPQAKIARFDGDNKREDSLAELYDAVKDGAIDILIGTQTLAKGLDLPRLATVGVVQADAGLALPDFAAEERTFELLTQVIGRVGRGHLDKAEVIIQSYQPDHPVIQTALHSDYEAFAKYLLQQRKAQQMPPYTYLARLSITYKTEKTTLAKIQQAYAALQNQPALTVSPPMPAFHERTNRGFTWQIIIKSTSREKLRQALIPYAGLGQYTLVLDPPSLL